MVDSFFCSEKVFLSIVMGVFRHSGGGFMLAVTIDTDFPLPVFFSPELDGFELQFQLL